MESEGCSEFLTNSRTEKRQYLVTYSQCDLNKFPTRQSFGEMLCHEFNSGTSKVRVQHWACCREPHSEEGMHYHCSIKLTGKKKWAMVRRNIQEKYGINVNFSSRHDYYYSAYQYVVKEDSEVFHSRGHPDLSNVGPPRTSKCIRANRDKAANKATPEGDGEQPGPSGSVSRGRKRLLSPSDIGDFIVAKKIYTKKELYTEANKRKTEGEASLYDFIMVTRDCSLEEIITKAWDLHNAPSEFVKSLTPRMDVIRQAATQPCPSPECDWLESALSLLDINGISRLEYAAAFRALLTEGRGKRRNIMLLGDSDCAKTHLLKPLTILFEGQVFTNPTSSGSKFSWVEAEGKDIFILNDFRWDKDLIAWSDLLRLLEGEPTRLPTPKNFRLKDILIDTDVPIFATAGEKVEFRGPYNTVSKQENQMMDNRWKYIKFNYVIPEERQRKIKPCGPCFSKLVLLGEE